MVLVSLSNDSDGHVDDGNGMDPLDGDDEPYEFRPSSCAAAAAGPGLSISAVGGGGGGVHVEYPDNKCLSLLLDESFLLDDEYGEAVEHGSTAGFGVGVAASTQPLPLQARPLTQQGIMQEYLRQVSQLRQQQMMMHQQHQQLSNLQLFKLNQQPCSQDQQQQQQQQQQYQQMLFRQQQHSILMAMQNNLLLPHVPKSNEKTAHAGQEVQRQTPEGQSTQVSSLFDNVAHRINPSPVYSCASHQQQGQYERSTTTMLNLPTLPPFIMHSSSASTAAAAAAAASSGFGSASCISGGSTIVSISSSIPKEPIKCGASDQLRDDDDITLSPSPHHVLMPNKRRGSSIGGDRRSEDATEPDAKRRVVQSVSQNQKSYTDAQHDTGVVEKEASESMKKESSACTVNVGSNFHYVQVVGGGALNHRLTSKHGNDDDCRSLNSSSVSSIGAASSFSSSSVTLLCPKDTISSTSRLQDYLDDLLTSRGYRPKKIGALELGYRPQPPTPLQLASFGYAVCSITTKAALRTTKRKDSDGAAARLSALLGAGLSPNPTNKFGESPFFVACKHGSYSLVEAFVDAGAEVSVADSFGRTPLHYAAWADPPCIKSIRLLLEKRKKSCNNSAGSDNDENYNARLFYVSDVHGKTPLDFVGISHHGMWIEFLEGVKEEFWPVREHDESSDDQCNVEEGVEYCPYSRWKSKASVDRDDKSSELERNNDVPDPKDALSLELAQKVANGHMMPQEARRQHQEQLQHQRQQQPP